MAVHIQHRASDASVEFTHVACRGMRFSRDGDLPPALGTRKQQESIKYIYIYIPYLVLHITREHYQYLHFCPTSKNERNDTTSQRW